MSGMCADYPDVPVADAEALEVAFRALMDDDEACDAAAIVLHLGWRPTAVPAASGPDADPAWDVRHQQERAAAWEAGVTPPPHDPAAEDWDAVELGIGAEVGAAAERAVYLGHAALARLRARDQARTDALIEAAWSYRQKADEWDTVRSIGSAVVASTLRMAADTLTRIAETT